jgi:transposase-like protein
MEDTAKTGRRTYDPAFKERAVAMAAESGNIAVQKTAESDR